jgi:large subunit ribosomal protein L29
MKKKYNEMGKKELEKILIDLKKDLRELRFDFVLSSVDNPAKKGIMSRDIARINTMLREMELGIRSEDNKYLGVKSGS